MPALALMTALAVQAVSTSSPLDGVWRRPGGNSIIKIALCGDNPCGTIVWASDRARNDSINIILDARKEKLWIILKGVRLNLTMHSCAP